MDEMNTMNTATDLDATNEWITEESVRLFAAKPADASEFVTMEMIARGVANRRARVLAERGVAVRVKDHGKGWGAMRYQIVGL